MIKIGMIDLKKLKKDPSNPNVMSTAKRKALKESLLKYGELQPVIIDQNNNLIDGHMRLKAYEETGKSQIPYIMRETSSHSERKLLQQVLNKVKGTHDENKDSLSFRDILKDHTIEDLSMSLGTTEQEILKTLNKLNEEKESVSFEAKKGEGPKQFTFIIDQDRRETVEQALRKTGMEDKNNALFEVCKKYVEGQ